MHDKASPDASYQEQPIKETLVTQTNSDDDEEDIASNPDAASTAAAERRLLWKIDLWILPVLSFSFVLSFLDKVNVANAKVYNLSIDLGLKSNEYDTALVIFFVSYVVSDIPFTIALRKVRPHVWLSVCMFFFGLISMCQGFTYNYVGLLAVRFFLGIAEAGSFSCCFYLLGMWYKRDEAQRRFTFFYSSVQLAGAFAGLLASAIGLLDGQKGYPAWRWIFIIEGAFTAAISIPFYFIIPDFPSQTTWLSADEKTLLLRRLASDTNAPTTHLTLSRILSILIEPKVLLGGLMYFCFVVPGYSYAYFAPTIIATYTDSPIHINLLSVPPWACGLIAAMVMAYLRDLMRHRLIFATLPIFLAIAALGVLLSIHDQPHTQYAALSLLVMNIWTALPLQICWSSMNIGGHARRSVALGWQIGFGNAGGIVAVYLFLNGQGPLYVSGYSVCLGFLVLTMLLNAAYAGLCWKENKTKEKALASDAAGEGEEVGLVVDDKSVGFRNML